MPYIIRDTTNLTQDPDPVKVERAATWKAFQARAKREGHPLAWVIWTLIRQYVERGIEAQPTTVRQDQSTTA